MKKNKLFLPLLFTALSLPLFAEGGVEFSGSVESLWGIKAPWIESNAAGRFSLGDTSLTSSLDAYFGNSSAFAKGSISYDALQTEKGMDALDFSLGELWIDYTDSFWGVRIGRQKTAWGKADGIDITNVICPSDMSSFSSLVGDDSKLAIDAIRLSFNGSSFTADAYWIPFFTPTKLPLEEGNSLRSFLVPSSVEFPIEALGTSLTLPVSINDFEKPEMAIWNGEYGLKLSGYFSLFDLSFYAFYGWDDLPFLDYSLTYNSGTPTMPNGILVGGEYSHMAMLGLDAAIPLGETVLRLETAFFPERHFQKSAEKIFEEKITAQTKAALTGSPVEKVDVSEKHNELSALAGLDWMPSSWTITAQYFCDYLFGNLENLERDDAYTHGATLSISKTVLNETLELSFSALVNFNAFDSLLAPSVNYSLSDQIKLGCTAYIFIPGPTKDGEYGVYKDLSSICISASFSF